MGELAGGDPGLSVVPFSRLRGHFAPDLHPDVEMGQRNRQDVWREFLEHFCGSGRGGRECTLAEFVRYHEGISAGIDNDQYFAYAVRSFWKLEPHTHNLHARNRRISMAGHIHAAESGLSS